MDLKVIENILDIDNLSKKNIADVENKNQEIEKYIHQQITAKEVALEAEFQQNILNLKQTFEDALSNKEKDVQEGDYEEYDSLAEVEAVRKTKIIKIKATKKGFTVRWKGIARACNGYEVAYSTKKSMKGAKNVRLASDKKICKVKKLKAKKKYYVRIRTYRIVKVNATYKRVYSAWSKIKTVRTK